MDRGSGTCVVVGVGREGSGASSGTDLRIMLRRSVLMWTEGTTSSTKRAVEEIDLGAAGWLV